tara:strand:+ start:7531 stop:8571 length:1041 start_codon:yes stop_codon:yes gene_type:complete
MNAIKIKYGNSNAFLVTNDRTKFDIIDKINTKLDINILDNNEELYLDKYETVLKNSNSITTYISIGKKVMLYLTRINNENICFIIELNTSKNTMYPKIFNVLLNFKSELYSNTLIEAELYKHKTKWYLLLDDILIYRNKKQENYILDNIKLLNNIVDNKHKHSEYDAFSIHCKTYYYIHELEQMISSTKISIKGVNLYYNNKKFIFNFNTQHTVNNIKYDLLPNINKNNIKEDTRTILNSYNEVNQTIKALDVAGKWKLNNTYTVQITKNKVYGIYNAHVYDSQNKIRQLGIIRTSTIEASLDIMKKFNKKTKTKINIIVKFNDYFNKYQFIKFSDHALTPYEQIT